MEVVAATTGVVRLRSLGKKDVPPHFRLRSGHIMILVRVPHGAPPRLQRTELDYVGYGTLIHFSLSISVRHEGNV